MKHLMQFLLAAIVVLSLAVAIRGGMYVREVRQQEAQLIQAIDQLALPGLTLARAPEPITTGEIWTAWLLKPFPNVRGILELFSGNLRWRPGDEILMWATYRSDETTTAVYERYLQKIQPILNQQSDDEYFLTVQQPETRAHIKIGPREFMPDGEIYATHSAISPERVATAVEISVSLVTPAEARELKYYPYPYP